MFKYLLIFLTLFGFAESYECSTFFLEDILEIGKANLILTLNKGVSIPVKLSITGSVFQSDGGDNLSLILQRTIYLKLKEEEVLVSIDKESWESFEEFLAAEAKAQIAMDAYKPILKISANVYLKNE